MTNIKNLLFKNFKLLSILTICCGVSIVALMIRVKITHSFFLLFLVWNLFLAVIPFGISFYLKHHKSLKKWQFIGYSCIWLLFLPNAPYIITDLIHLQLADGLLLLLDLVVISSFAISGLFLYLASVGEMKILFQENFSRKTRIVFFTALPFLCGFGIYLGRFLRFNSWDILQNPTNLAATIVAIVLYPATHWIAWTVTLGFGVLLWLGQRWYKPIV